MAAADSSAARGDIRAAGVIYARLASRRPPNASSQTASLRLNQLRKDAQTKLDEIDLQLNSGGVYISIGDNASLGTSDASVDALAGISQNILDAFRKYEDLIDQYGGLPGIGPKIEAHVAKLRRQPANAAVLNEAPARKMWDQGQQHEHNDQLCCAYWVYKEAAKLKPAPSASLAADRLAELEHDVQVVTAAETCRELKWCHGTYRLAEQLLSARPERAKELFAAIVARAPQDSEVYQAAKKQIGSP